MVDFVLTLWNRLDVAEYVYGRSEIEDGKNIVMKYVRCLTIIDRNILASLDVTSLPEVVLGSPVPAAEWADVPTTAS